MMSGALPKSQFLPYVISQLGGAYVATLDCAGHHRQDDRTGARRMAVRSWRR
jgi:glycerol uptake facilitator-like aquaporin